jgi:DNA polymerase-3 subunit alpha
VLSQAADTSIASLVGDEGRPDGSTVTIAGMITQVTRKTTRNGNLWAIAQVEDLAGAIEVLFFPQTYTVVSHELREDVVCVIRGRVNRRDDQLAVNAQEMSIPDISDQGHRGPMTIMLPVTRCTPPMVGKLKDVLCTHPGVTEVHLRLTQADKATVMRLDDTLRVTPSPALYGDLKALLGPSCLV